MRKDKKMWKMCIDVHGVVSANSQCPGNVPIARRFPKLGNSLKPTGKQMKPERFRSWVWCPAPWAWDECMRLCEWCVCILAFSSGVGRRLGPTSKGGASRLSAVSLVFFLFAGFYVWTLWTPQVDENEGRLVDTFGASAAKKPFPSEKIGWNPWIFEYLY